MQPTESAVIVPFPSLDPLVGEYRQRMDRAAAWGVPAHVTVVYPFVPPPVGADTLELLAAALTDVSAFECEFARVEWFGDDVVWLAPEPDRPFRDMTAAVWRAFPDHPPYGGQWGDSIPHLTVGHTDPAGMRAAADELPPHLPVHAPVDRVWVLEGTDAPGSWGMVAELSLAAPRPAG
ncbi:2'-5' RNA ligase family protein [Actinophytocola sp. NPDC049390]|uniref:2'-5' RNA ligase family protein n=1 Tax=Actinophytocola sp. NPDC049390 TaxID=3363894 RepID=UPI0037B5FE35